MSDGNIDSSATNINQGQSTAAASEAGSEVSGAPAESTSTDAGMQGENQGIDPSNNVPRENSAEEKPADGDENTPPPDPYSRQFATLTKRDRQIREREQGLKSREQTIAAREQAVADVFSALEAGDASALLRAAKSRGLDFQNLVEAALEDGQPAKPEKLISDLKKEIEELKTQISGKEQAAAERRIQSVFDGTKKEIGTFLETNKDNYELTLARLEPDEAREEVFKVIELQHQATGKLLSYKDAADMLEKHFEEEAERFVKTKKLSSRFAPKVEAATPTEKGEAPLSQQTLTSSHTNSAAVQSNDERYLSDEESKERMIRRIRGETHTH